MTRAPFIDQGRPARPGPVDGQAPDGVWTSVDVLWGVARRNGYFDIEDPSAHAGMTQHAYPFGRDEEAICGYRPPRRRDEWSSVSRPMLALPSDAYNPRCDRCQSRIRSPWAVPQESERGGSPSTAGRPDPASMTRHLPPVLAAILVQAPRPVAIPVVVPLPVPVVVPERAAMPLPLPELLVTPEPPAIELAMPQVARAPEPEPAPAPIAAVAPPAPALPTVTAHPETPVVALVPGAALGVAPVTASGSVVEPTATRAAAPGRPRRSHRSRAPKPRPRS